MKSLASLMVLFLTSLVFPRLSADSPDAPYLGRSPWVEAAGKIIDRSASRIAAEYGGKIIGSGGCLMSDISSISLTFEFSGPLSVSEARILTLECLDLVLNEMNSDLAARPYLAHHPADYESVRLFLVISGPRGAELFDPEISMVSATRGTIRYESLDANDYSKCYTKHTETLEEARSLG